MVERVDLFAEDRFMDDATKEEKGIIQEYGEALPGQPTAIPIHMPSYALMWKLGGGITTTIPPTKRKGGFLPGTVNPEKFSQKVYDALNLGHIVSYNFSTGKERDMEMHQFNWKTTLPEMKIGGLYRKSHPIDTGALIDTIKLIGPDVVFGPTGGDQYLRGKGSFGVAGYHEAIHYGLKFAHPSTKRQEDYFGKYWTGEFYADQVDFEKQSEMMMKTAELAIDQLTYTDTDGNTQKLDIDYLWRLMADGRDITGLLPNNFFDDEMINGKKYTWQERTVLKAKNKLQAHQNFPNLYKNVSEWETNALQDIVSRQEEKEGIFNTEESWISEYLYNKMASDIGNTNSAVPFISR